MRDKRTGEDTPMLENVMDGSAKMSLAELGAASSFEETLAVEEKNFFCSLGCLEVTILIENLFKQ
jgi:hypothetical protein